MLESQASNLTPSDQELLERAAKKAADQLLLNESEVDEIIPRSDVSRRQNAQILFVRLYRSLDAIVGGDDNVAAAWIRNFNLALNSKPIEKIKQDSGLQVTVEYLDSMRAKV